MSLKFTCKVAGVHTAKVTNDVELALTNAGGIHGWHIVLRNAGTRKVSTRLASGIRTLPDAKATADRLASNPRFDAVLLRAALA